VRQVTLVGIRRDSVYFNNDKAKTLDTLAGESISQITALDADSNQIDYDFQKAYYSGSMKLDDDSPHPLAPDMKDDGVCVRVCAFTASSCPIR
jgi:hypothetical protein